MQGSLYLPRPNIDEIDEAFNALLPPRVRNLDLAARVESRGTEEKLRWGGYIRYDKDDPARTAEASVYRAVLMIPALQSDGVWSLDKVARTCIDDFPSWTEYLTDWIEILTGADLNTAHPVDAALEPEFWTSQAWIRSAGTERDYEFVNPPITLHLFSGQESLDSQSWSAAVRAANEGRELPEIWTLIRDAFSAARRQQFRRAVLDAATAVELLIDQELRNELLLNNSSVFVDKLLETNWQVTRRIDLMLSLGMWLPVDIRSKLTTLRNQITHKNFAVSQPQAADALRVANDLAVHYLASLLK